VRRVAGFWLPRIKAHLAKGFACFAGRLIGFFEIGWGLGCGCGCLVALRLARLARRLALRLAH